MFGFKMNFTSVQEICGWIMSLRGKIGNVVVVGLAAIFWVVWETRNKACFENIFPYDPTSVIVQAAHWLDFWSGLQRQGLQGMQDRGAKMLLRVAAEVFSRKKGWEPAALRLAC